MPDPTDNIDPIYHWRIQGGSIEYPRLGQTWSRPKLSSILLANEPNIGDLASTTALLFAGGYDDAQDNGFGPGGLGNAIYIANPFTGERWLSVSTTDPGGLAPHDVVVVTDDPLVAIDVAPKMTFPIPSDLALLDSTGDGNTNRILVGDTGGQLWRVEDTIAKIHTQQSRYELALEFATRALQNAPEEQQPQQQQLIDFIRSQQNAP